jgi:hypothetical protein
MLRFARNATHWVGRHAFPAVAAGVIAVGAAAGGVGYAVASQHSTAAPVSSSTSTPASPSPAPSTKHKATTGTRGAAVIQRALGLLASQTGQTVASVRSQLETGKSINDIAGAKAPAIESEILAQVNKLAARALSAGKISAAQESAALATVKTKVEALMAEPGTQLLKDAQKFLQFLQLHGAGHRPAAASPAPSPAA